MTKTDIKCKHLIWITLANLLVLCLCTIILLEEVYTWSARYLCICGVAVTVCNLALWMFLQGGIMTVQKRTVLMLVILLLLGILSNAAIPSTNVPDEETHYEVTVRLSEDPASITDRGGVSYPIYCYLFSAASLAIGRVVGISGQTFMILGRMANYVLFLALMVLSCKVAPDLRLAVWAIAALPSTIWLAASYSYDGWNLGFSILFVCYSWWMATRSSRVGLRELVLYAVILVAFAPIKYIYVLLGLLIFAVPRQRWQNLKGILIGMMILMAGFVIVMRARLVEIIAGLTSSTADPRGLEQGLSGTAYTISYVVRHPASVLMTFARTLFDNTETMTERLLVGEFHSDYVPDYLTVALGVLFVALMLLSTRESLVGRERTGHPRWTALVYRATLVLGILGVYASFLFLYSYYNEGQIGEISGVQGRYFLPLVLLLAPAGSARLSGACCDWMDRHEVSWEQLWAAIVYVGMLVTLCRTAGFVA